MRGEMRGRDGDPFCHISPRRSAVPNAMDAETSSTSQLVSARSGRGRGHAGWSSARSRSSRCGGRRRRAGRAGPARARDLHRGRGPELARQQAAMRRATSRSSAQDASGDRPPAHGCAAARRPSRRGPTGVGHRDGRQDAIEDHVGRDLLGERASSARCDGAARPERARVTSDGDVARPRTTASARAAWMRLIEPRGLAP